MFLARVLKLALIASFFSFTPQAIAQSFDDLVNIFAREMLRSQSSQSQEAKDVEVSWLIISSRTDAAEAVTVAESFVATLGPTMVVQSSNGRYAILAGYLDKAKSKQNVEALKAIELIPQDSILSSGRGLTKLVWRYSDGDESSEVVWKPELRNTVSRLQRAFAQLELYSGAIDGAVGPATSKAFADFKSRYGLIAANALDEGTIVTIEKVAVDGFANDSERILARDKGFPDARSMEKARVGGFLSYDEYAEAETSGFISREEFRKFMASGFSTKPEFEIARQNGMATKQQFDAYQSELTTNARIDANELLDDANEFLRLNPNAPNILDLATSASELKAAVGDGKSDVLLDRTKALHDALSKLAGFNAFEAAKVAERTKVEQEKVDVSAALLSSTVSAVERWIAQNLTHEATADLAAELIKAKTALSALNLIELDRYNSQIERLLNSWSIKADIAQIISSGGTAPAKEKSPDYQITQTVANAFLLNGSNEEMVALYNASANAPSLIRNLVGDFVFESKVASVCTFPVRNEPSFKRAVVTEMAKFEAKVTKFSVDACNADHILEYDVLLINRGEFLRAVPSIVTSVLKKVEEGELRRFDNIRYSTLVAAQAYEDSNRLAIAQDVGTDARNGYGALVVAAGNPRICAVAKENIDVHLPMIEDVANFVASDGRQRPDWQQSTADETFRAIQRQECSVLYASQPDLKRLTKALALDGRKFEFLPLWYPAELISQTDKSLKEQDRNQKEAAEKRRLEAEEERKIADAKRLRQEAGAKTREAELQVKFGAEARALQLVLDEGIQSLVLKEKARSTSEAGAQFGDAATLLFPLFTSRQAELASDFWSPDTVASEIVEYGIGKWKERAIEAIALKVTVKVESSKRGERRDECFLLATLIDAEFKTYRDPIELTCEDYTADLGTWIEGHNFESRWKAN